MERTSGRPEILVGLIDGPLAVNHPDLAGGNIREVSGIGHGTCTQGSNAARMHGTQAEPSVLSCLTKKGVYSSYTFERVYAPPTSHAFDLQG